MARFQMRLDYMLCAPIVLMLISRQVAGAQDCFQCDSTSDITCSEYLPDDHQIYGESCGDIYQAHYCVKMTGMFEGELGTKRFCSARDWGNYCEWIQRPADEREYRACVFTCSGSNCNTAHHIHPSGHAITTATALLTFLLRILASLM